MRAATQASNGRPSALAIPAIKAAMPRFQIRIMIVASRLCSSESANDVMAAIASPPAALTMVGRNGAAWRSMISVATERGTLVIKSVAKQRAASPIWIPFGFMLTQSVRQP